MLSWPSWGPRSVIHCYAFSFLPRPVDYSCAENGWTLISGWNISDREDRYTGVYITNSALVDIKSLRFPQIYTVATEIKVPLGYTVDIESLRFPQIYTVATEIKVPLGYTVDIESLRFPHIYTVDTEIKVPLGYTVDIESLRFTQIYSVHRD